MKKIIGLILVFILLFAVASDAFAGSRPQITKNPETATVKKGGKVTFSIKTKGTVATIIWYFVDPATGNEYSGKKLSGAVKEVKIAGATNNSKITLKNVPESMHGWKVYAHVNGNGYKIDSEPALLLIAGMDIPEEASESPDEAQAEAPDEVPSEASDEDPSETPDEPSAEEPGDVSADEPGKMPAEETPADENTDEKAPVDQPEIQVDSSDNEPEEGGAPTAFTVTSTTKVLRLLDASGNVTDDTPVSSLKITGVGSVLVSSEEPIISWTLNGLTVQPAEPVREFRILNVTSDLFINIKTSRVSAAETVVDENRMCKVTCTGCTFSYSRGKLRSVTEGEVPAGAPINIVADSSDLATNGYSVNGGEPEYEGQAGFRLVVTEDVTIVCK